MCRTKFRPDVDSSFGLQQLQPQEYWSRQALVIGRNTSIAPHGQILMEHTLCGLVWPKRF